MSRLTRAIAAQLQRIATGLPPVPPVPEQLPLPDPDTAVAR